jgi:tetratricopeptide (TPR) repeat protein
MKNVSFFLSFLCVSINISAHNASTLHCNFWANYKHFSGKLADAQHWYTKLFSSPRHTSIYSYKGYLFFLAETKQFKKIIELMPTINTKFSQDPDVQLIFVTALNETNQIKKADSLVISLSQSFKTHAEIALLAAQAYLRQREPENALLAINGYLNNTPRRPNNFVFYFLQSHVHIQLNQLQPALDSIKKCLELHPHFDKGWLLSASLHEKQGKIEEALNGYTTFLELSGGNSQIEQHILGLMLLRKNMEQQKSHLLSRTININNALILFRQQRYPQALAHTNKCIEAFPDNDQYRLFKIDILCAMKNFNQAASAITAWIKENPENVIWPKTLCLLLHNGMPYKDIINTFTVILEKQPHNLWCNLYCADMCMRNAHHTLAITCLERALPIIKDNNLASKIAYQLALLQYENNNHTSMHSYLEKAHSLNPECPHIQNSLAYYWATKGKDLAKAHDFIEKALKCNSTNAYFLDTQALILYKEKKFTQAQEILEKLVTHNNSTMLLHLAKVHYSLNNKDIADTFTKKAETLVKNNQEKKALEKMKILLAQK